jgi:general L-amino acid transport system permease protein
MNDQIAFLLDNLPNLLIGFPGQRPGGLLMSVLLAVLAVNFGFLIAVGIGRGHESRLRPLRWLCHLYVQVLRGLPLILLLLLVHQVFGHARRQGVIVTAQTSALIALTLYSSAYQAEIVRAGLQAVPQPLVESARSMGSTPLQTYRLVRLRYALRVMLPAFTGQAISLFKDTSVVVIIGVADLMTVARTILGGDVGNVPYWVGLYLVVGCLYFAVAFSLSRLALRLEQRSNGGDLVHSLANY